MEEKRLASPTEIDTLLTMVRERSTVDRSRGRVYGKRLFRQRPKLSAERLKNIETMRIANEIAYGSRKLLDSVIVRRRYHLIGVGAFMCGVSIGWMLALVAK